ncbi:MAG: hypothetical protein KKF54_00705 [Candidatus Omnitrophica bacterium]|nr:hypothetical protein [Candidatus Omnitrophota bacterium]
MEKNISQIPIWNKIIKQLNTSKIDYILVGAAALVIHGLPRSTLDLDIYVPAKKEVLENLFKIAYSLGLKSDQKSILTLSNSPKLFTDQWICFSYKGQDILDIFFSKAKDFDELFKNSEIKKDNTLSIRIASLHDIFMMKKSCARAIDIADIALIKEVKKHLK